MAKIIGVIPVQNFEIIRDQIGVILTTELAAQAVANGVGVWSERVISFDKTELPAINITYDSTPYDNHNPKSRTGENQYFIDVVVNAKHTGTEKEEKGDVISSKFAERIAGIVAYILSSGEYYYLDFAPGLIQSRWISEIKVGRLTENDAIHTIVARVIFKVKASETVGDLAGVDGEIISSTVKLNETDKGFLYEIIKT